MTIGAIGCSNTKLAVEGYNTVSTLDKFWFPLANPGYSGQTVIEWANPSSVAWAKFDLALAANPATDRIWWQICVKTNSGANQTHADAAYDLIRQRTAVPVVASPLDATVKCRQGDDVVSAQLLEILVAAGKVERGPIITPLTAAQTVDGCHANAAGKLIWGADLSAFFD